MILEPTAYHHKLLNDEAGLIVSERLTLSPRFPVHIGEFDNRDGSSRETEPLVPLAKALDYAAALVAAERERCAKVCEAEAVLEASSDPTDIAYNAAISHCSIAIREGGQAHD